MKTLAFVAPVLFLVSCTQNARTDGNKQQMTKEEYLDKYVFHGLTDINTGFDPREIKYYSEEDFEVVLIRIKTLGLGVYGIEPWRNGKFYDVRVYEDYAKDPTDPAWYLEAFDQLKTSGKDSLQYSASYFVPDSLLTQ